MTTLPLEKVIAETLGMFDETFEKVTGHYLDPGASLFETLAGIDAATASRPVSATCASLAAQTDHVRFYLDVMEDVMLNREQEKYDWGDIWSRVESVTPDEWAAIQARLRESHGRVRALIATPESWAVEDAFGAAMLIIVHTAYHLGEIRQALCTLR